MKWLNMGGGHHITREDYDVECLIRCVRHMKETYGLEIYLEPGEAIALNAGYLVTEVMDVVENGIKILILDASAACHMPDVLEMPYRPPLKDSGLREKRNIRIVCPPAPVLPGMSSETIPLTGKSTRETGCILRIWRFIPW